MTLTWGQLVAVVVCVLILGDCLNVCKLIATFLERISGKFKIK